MRQSIVAAIAIAAVAAGAGWAVHSTKIADSCPSPSAASVTALFAPCQAVETAMAPMISRKDAVQMGLMPADERSWPGEGSSTRFAEK